MNLEHTSKGEVSSAIRKSFLLLSIIRRSHTKNN